MKKNDKHIYRFDNVLYEFESKDLCIFCNVLGASFEFCEDNGFLAIKSKFKALIESSRNNSSKDFRKAIINLLRSLHPDKIERLKQGREIYLYLARENKFFKTYIEAKLGRDASESDKVAFLVKLMSQTLELLLRFEQYPRHMSSPGSLEYYQLYKFLTVFVTKNDVYTSREQASLNGIIDATPSIKVKPVTVEPPVRPESTHQPKYSTNYNADYNHTSNNQYDWQKSDAEWDQQFYERRRQRQTPSEGVRHDVRSPIDESKYCTAAIWIIFYSVILIIAEFGRWQRESADILLKQTMNPAENFLNSSTVDSVTFGGLTVQSILGPNAFSILGFAACLVASQVILRYSPPPDLVLASSMIMPVVLPAYYLAYGLYNACSIVASTVRGALIGDDENVVANSILPDDRDSVYFDFANKVDSDMFNSHENDENTVKEELYENITSDVSQGVERTLKVNPGLIFSHHRSSANESCKEFGTEQKFERQSFRI